MLSVLDRYIGKTIFHTIIMTLLTLVSLSGIIRFVEQLRKIGQGNYSILGASLFMLLSVPKDIEIFFPMAALLGTMLGLGSLTTYSELVAMQASGFSYLQIASSVIKTAIFLVLLVMSIGEWITPVSERMAYNYRTQMIYGDSILAKKNGLWIKDGNDFIFIERIIRRDKLAGVNIYQFGENGRLQSLSYALTATFNKDSWKLSQINKLNITNLEQITARKILTEEWKTNLTPDRLSVVILDPHTLSISGLYDYINYLKKNGQKSNRYQLNMWKKIFLPFSVAVTILIVLSFIFGPLHCTMMGVKIIIGISLGFLFYVLDQTFGLLSLVYDVNPIFGALFPSIIFLIISIAILLKSSLVLFLFWWQAIQKCIIKHIRVH